MKAAMMKMKCVSPEVYVANDDVVAIRPEEIGFLEEKVKLSPRHRTRLCAHSDNELTLHEMLVVYTGSTFIRPNMHPGKDESLHILKGAVDFVFFDDAGRVTEVVPLGDQASGRAFYVRVPANMYHSMVMRSDKLVIHEVINGPFRKDTTTVFAPWGPEETDVEGVARFTSMMTREIERLGNTGRAPVRMRQENPEVFHVDEPVSKIGQAEIDFIKERLARTDKNRVRVCTHKRTDEKVQEMFIAFGRGSYLRPSKHLGKDESVNVLEGRSDVVLFDEEGAITDVISVGDRTSGLPFFFRTPHERWHAWIVRSDAFIVHETTEGPFRREDTIFASWSPEPDDGPAVARYIQELGDSAEAWKRERDA